jgi:hypothetical protein
MSMAAPTAVAAVAGQPCSRCQSPCAFEDIRCAVCGIALALPQQAFARAVAQILRCEDCGAALRYSAEHQTAKCGFCGSALKLETPADPIEQAEWIVPFSVPPEQASQVLRAWLGKQGFFTPSDLQSAARLESIQPLWWATWLVDARALVSWTADSNYGSNRSDWAPHSGRTQTMFQNLVVSASRGLSLHEAARLSPYTNVASADRSFRGPGGATVEQFDAQRSAARKIVVAAIEATAAARLQEGAIPGSRFRNVHVAVVLEALTTRRFLLPAYVLAYRYDKKLFRAVVHGQEAGCVIGSAPRSVWKIALVVLGVIFLIVVAIAIVAVVNG